MGARALDRQAGGLPGGPAAGYLGRAAPCGELRAVCVLAQVDRVRGTRPGDVPGQRDPPHAGWPSIAAPFELGPQIKQLSFAAPRPVPRPARVRCCGCAGRISRRRRDLLPRGALKQRVELVELSAYAAADLFAELEYAFVRDRVAGVVAVLGAGDHAGAVQDPEVL